MSILTNLANKFKAKAPPIIKDVTPNPIDVYEVRWHSRRGNYSSDTKPEVAVFTSKDEALKFDKALKDAFKLLRYTSGTDTTITKG